MKVTYVDSAMSSGTATQLDSVQTAGTGGDRVLRRIIVGKPVAAATITVYGTNNAVVGGTSDIVFKYTYPTFGAGTPASDQISFSSNSGGRSHGDDGMVLWGGGSVVTTSAMQVSFLWDDPGDD